MRSRSWVQRIQDILEMITEIESFTNGITFEDFRGDTKTVKAVLYNLTIIGEAARNIPPEVEVRYPEIPWIDMRGMRNVVIHEYFRVNWETIWQTLQDDLPPLGVQLRELLERIDEAEAPTDS